MTELDLIYKRLRSRLATTKKHPQYLKFVRGLPCCICFKLTSEPHHIFGSYGSLKTSDLATVPLCRSCHSCYEANPKHNPELIEHMVKTLIRYIEEEL